MTTPVHEQINHRIPGFCRKPFRLARGLLRQLSGTPHAFHMSRWVNRFGWDHYGIPVENPVPAGSLVLDIGGFHGDWAVLMAQRYRCRVRVFEPVPAFWPVIEKRIAGLDSIELSRYGLGSADRQASMTLAQESSSEFSGAGNRVQVCIRDAIRVLDELAELDIALAKINIEGGEYELLPRLISSGAIDRIGQILIQFHDFTPDARHKRNEIRQKMNATHRCALNYPFVWELWVHR